jgi:hypothetical protein
MAKILEFRLPEPKALTVEQRAQQLLTPDQALDAIVVGMVCHVMPLWVEKKWPFRALELMAEELRDAMSKNVPTEVHQFQVDAIIDELKPVWYEIAEQAIYIF